MQGQSLLLITCCVAAGILLSICFSIWAYLRPHHFPWNHLISHRARSRDRNNSLELGLLDYRPNEGIPGLSINRSRPLPPSEKHGPSNLSVPPGILILPQTETPSSTTIHHPTKVRIDTQSLIHQADRSTTKHTPSTSPRRHHTIFTALSPRSKAKHEAQIKKQHRQTTIVSSTSPPSSFKRPTLKISSPRLSPSSRARIEQKYKSIKTTSPETARLQPQPQPQALSVLKQSARMLKQTNPKTQLLRLTQSEAKSEAKGEAKGEVKGEAKGGPKSEPEPEPKPKVEAEAHARNDTTAQQLTTTQRRPSDLSTAYQEVLIAAGLPITSPLQSVFSPRKWSFGPRSGDQCYARGMSGMQLLSEGEVSGIVSRNECECKGECEGKGEGGSHAEQHSQVEISSPLKLKWKCEDEEVVSPSGTLRVILGSPRAVR